MRKTILILFLITGLSGWTQEDQQAEREKRWQTIENNLQALVVDNPGLAENVKLDISMGRVTLPQFLLGIAEVHKVNINVDPSLQAIPVASNFANVAVADMLLFFCKQYDLTIDFTGNILTVKQFIPEIDDTPQEVDVTFNALENSLSMDLKGDRVADAFRKIIDVSGKNLLFTDEIEDRPLRIYLKDVPFELALEKLAEVNRLTLDRSKGGFYLFRERTRTVTDPNNATAARIQSGGSSYFYEILDPAERLLNVDFTNVSVATLVRDLCEELKLNYYVATSLEEAGTTSITASNIYFDELLDKIFERNATFVATRAVDNPNIPQGNLAQRLNPQAEGGTSGTLGNRRYTYKKENDIYYFGTSDQLSVRTLEVVPLMHRSIELLGDPMQSADFGRMAGRTTGGSVNYLGYGNTGGQPGTGFTGNLNRNNLLQVNSGQQFGSYENKAEALVSILPDEITADLDIRIDYELNSFLVSGPSSNINRFKEFIKEIDKPVPVVLIEVMLIEVRQSATVETGISWGIGDEPVETRGAIFPETDVTLGANTVNRIIGGFDGFGSFNIGQVVPEFFATIKAMEQNGNIKIRSSPKLSTLNGHRAHLSIGETTYYVVTSQNFFGSQIPTTSEIRNFQPIDAQLAVSIKPLVSGDGQVTLEINVIQSDFSSERIDEDAPPGLTSREFSSIIRMQDQDLAVLGGLEEKIKNDSGSGVPLLSRIPVVKWLFSNRKREDSKTKLTILIKPTIIH